MSTDVSPERRPITFDRAAVEVLLAPSIADPESVTKGRRRKPITESARVAAHELVKAVERLGRLVEDDRFPRNAEQVARDVRHDLLRASDLLAEVVARIPNLTKETTR